MAATATPQSNPQTELRAGRLSSMRDRMGRTGRGALMGLSMLGATPSFQRDDTPSFENNPVAEMRASRHTAQRYANPGAMTPRLQEMSNSLRDNDTDQEDDADEIDQQAAQVADESDQAGSLQLAARARSRAKAATGDATQKMVEQMQKKGEELIAELKTEISAKGASLADEGEFFELVDSAGTGMSVVRSTLSIFQDSFDERTKSLLTKMGLPMIKMGKGIGEIAVAGTFAQVGKWSSVLFVFIPFLLVFTILAYGSIASIIHGNVTNAYTLMKGAL